MLTARLSTVLFFRREIAPRIYGEILVASIASKRTTSEVVVRLSTGGPSVAG